MEGMAIGRVVEGRFCWMSGRLGKISGHGFGWKMDRSQAMFISMRRTAMIIMDWWRGVSSTGKMVVFLPHAWVLFICGYVSFLGLYLGFIYGE
jgi:hypothetical protein